MKKLESILGFDTNFDEDGNVVINDLPNYPQESINSRNFYNKLELIKIEESKIIFPTQMIEWVITISASNKETLMDYFKIDGIKKVVEENKSKLIGKLTFVKAELFFPKKSKYPKLAVHFYQVVNEGGVKIYDEYEMLEFCDIFYENTKQFTKKRIADLEPYVNTYELFQIPFLPIEMVRMNDEYDILNFPNHELAKKASELPF
jgi:hypothetical protein